MNCLLEDICVCPMTKASPSVPGRGAFDAWGVNENRPHWHVLSLSVMPFLSRLRQNLWFFRFFLAWYHIYWYNLFCWNVVISVQHTGSIISTVRFIELICLYNVFERKRIVIALFAWLNKWKPWYSDNNSIWRTIWKNEFRFTQPIHKRSSLLMRMCLSPNLLINKRNGGIYESASGL